jgi:hypothetical protein
MKLDKSKSYGTVYGHDSAMFQQGDTLFDGAGNPIAPSIKEASKPKGKDAVIEHDGVEQAKDFLKNILKQGPLSKSVIFKTANDNNQAWEDVKNAAVSLNINRVQLKGMETWKLTDVA